MAKKKQRAVSRDEDANTLIWCTPGAARATIFFSDASEFSAIFVSLMPAYEYDASVKALIGDSITVDDIMDVNGFEPVFQRLGEDRQFVTVSLVNRSPKKRAFELAFLFSDNQNTEQRYEYEMEPNSSLVDYIGVKFER